MQLTDHTDYGLRGLIWLAALAPRRQSSIELADRSGVSRTHMKKVVQSLQNAGFVATFRGRGGGVQLARPAEDIRVGEVVRALEPGLDFVECFRAGPCGCPLDGGCTLKQVLTRAKAAMLAELDGTTIADIAAGSVSVHARAAE